MDTAQIAELLEPFVPVSRLSSDQLNALATYLELLERWNARTNLTAVRGSINIVLRHFGESLFAASMLVNVAGRGDHPTTTAVAEHKVGERGASSVIDVGSGAGFPGVPIKIYAPWVTLTLVESQNKKATFLKEVIRTLRLKDVSVFGARAETFCQRADVVTLRAVEQFDRILPVAASLVRTSKTGEATAGGIGAANSGRLALLIGEGQRGIVERTLPDFRWDEPLPVPLSAERILLVGEPKVRQR